MEKIKLKLGEEVVLPDDSLSYFRISSIGLETDAKSMLNNKEYFYCRNQLDQFLTDFTSEVNCDSALIYLRSIANGFEYGKHSTHGEFDLRSFLYNILKINSKFQILIKELNEENNTT